MSDSPFDTPKVMDVNRPGRSRVLQPSSRPVVAQVVSGEASDSGINVSVHSSHKKSIGPLEDKDRDETEEKIDYKDDNLEVDNLDSVDKEETEEKKEVSSYNESDSSISDKEDIPESTPKQEQSESFDVSNSAGVDALAANATSKREAHEKIEEEAKREAEVKDLISSKQFFVPIGATSPKSSGKTFSIILISLILVAAISFAGYTILFSGSN